MPSFIRALSQYLIGQVKQVSLEKEGLDSQLANSVQTCIKLQETVTQGEDARRSVSEQYSILQEEHDALLDQLRQHRRSSAAELGSEKLAADALKAQLADLHDVHSKHMVNSQEINATLADSVASLQQSLQSSESQVKRLQGSLSEAYDELRKLNASNASLAMEMASFKTQVSDLQEEIHKGKSTQLQYQNIVNKDHEQRVAYETELNAFKAATKQLQADIAQRDTAIAALERSAALAQDASALAEQMQLEVRACFCVCFCVCIYVCISIFVCCVRRLNGANSLPTA